MGHSRDEVEARIRGLIREIVGFTSPNGQPMEPADAFNWDSVTRIELIFCVEDDFGIRFPEATLPELISLEALVDGVLDNLDD